VLSIVVPSRLRTPRLRTLEGLAHQDARRPYEVIVVADGAEPEAVAALRGTPAPFTLRVLEQAHAGQGAARNTGAAEARHGVLVFLDDDMALNDAFLSALAAAIDAGADVALATIRIGDWVPSSPYTREVRDWEQGMDADPGGPVPFNQVFFAATAVRAERFAEVGGFDASFTAPGRYGNEDLDLGCRLAKAGARIVQVPGAVARTDLVTDQRLLLARARLAGQADVRLARKHPDLTDDLFARRLEASRIQRVAARAVLAVPAAGGAAVPLHRLHRALARLGRDGPVAYRLWYAARTLRYWQGVVDAGGRALVPPIVPSRRRG
jgi:glycosyltransferase involved in cell wall biosynthesis